LPVQIVHDPFRLFAGNAIRVFGTGQLRNVFGQIDGLLSAGAHGTQEKATYIVDSSLWTHFASYGQMAGVQVEEYLPRTLVGKKFGLQPPDWLTNDLIFQTGFLDFGADRLIEDNWTETFVEWLLPGGRNAETLEAWMRLAYDSNGLGHERLSDEIRELLWRQFAAKAKAVLQSHELEAIYNLWTGYRTPKEFIVDALQAPASGPLRSMGSESGPPGDGQPQDTGRLVSVPLVFPLPGDLHKEVSNRFTRAFRRARLEGRDLTKTALPLNAMWDGLIDELEKWLRAKPNALTQQAAEHLESLPGSQSVKIAEVLNRFRPHRKPAQWDSLEEIEGWITAYSAYIRNAFCRRTLPESWADDPAAGFSKWITENITVPFNHQDYGFFQIARQVKGFLSQGRSVILVMVDAWAFHLANALITEMSATLGEQPSSVRPVFSAIPTLTEVSKPSMITGLRPDQCNRRIELLLPEVYQLTEAQVLFVDSWKDPARAALTKANRLIVYRDNSLDKRLKECTDYVALLDAFESISRTIADRVSDWAGDLKYLTHTDPVVIVTSDHGFTYGPSPDRKGDTAASLEGHLRCAAVEDGQPEHPKGSVALLSKEAFHLTRSYVAATSRKFGHGTMSGWVMQHGGLLPEEVIVPLAAWFAGEAYVAHPSVEIPSGALRRAHTWEISLEVRNDSAVPMSKIHVSVRLGEVKSAWSRGLEALAPGRKVLMLVKLEGRDIPEGEKLKVHVSTRLATRSGQLSGQRSQEFLVSRKLELLERTAAQDDFEAMF